MIIELLVREHAMIVVEKHKACYLSKKLQMDLSHAVDTSHFQVLFSQVQYEVYDS